MSKANIENRPPHGDTPSRRSVLARLNPISNFIEAGAKRDVESIVKKIEHIQRHDETTIFERHIETPISLTDAELSKLKSLCKKLVDLSSSGRATNRYACEEVIRLSVEDPRIHSFLKERQFFPSESFDISRHTYCDLARFTVDDASFEIHALWSDLFQMYHGTLEYGPDNDMIAEYLTLKNSYFTGYLENHDLSFLSARYLRHALELHVAKNALYFIVNLWRRYMKIAKADARRTGDGFIVEWSNLNDCFQCLPSGVLRTAFVPPSVLAEFLARMIENNRAIEVPNAFQTFFSAPHIVFAVKKGVYRYSSPRISPDNIHFRLLPVYQASLFDVLDKSHRASALRRDQVEPKLRTLVRKTVLDSEKGPMWREYCEEAKRIWDYHYRNESLEVKATRLSSEFLSLVKTTNDERNASATFLAASLESDWPESNIQIPSRVVSNVQDLTGVLSLPLFDNVPYLRRYRIKDTGRIFITLDYLPEPPTALIKSSEENLLHDFTVETFLLKGSEALWLHVDGQCAPFNINRQPFNSAFFTPIYAEGPKKGKKATYVAGVKKGSVYHLTYAVDGSSSVKYTDEVGDEHVSMDFSILAKKSWSTVEDDITNTTIGRWLPFWPIKDPAYVALSESAKSDDEHLEALLNSFRREGLA